MSGYPIADLETFGDTRNRDIYGRNDFRSVQSTGAASASLTHEFFGVNTADASYIMATLTATETGIEDAGSGVFTIATADGAGAGSAVTEVLSLGQAESTFTTSNLILSGNLSASTIVQDTLADGAEIQLTDDATAGMASIALTVGDLDGVTANATPLTVSYDGTQDGGTVDIVGNLFVNGTDVEALITGGNPWDGTDPGGVIADLKDTYTQVRIGIADTFVYNNATVGLDLNGTMQLRGNNLFMFDESTTTHYSVLTYDQANSDVRLRTSRADDNLIFQTATNVDGSREDRLSIAGGLGTTTATFENVRVGIGGIATTNALEVTGDMSLTGGITTGTFPNGDVDVSQNSVVNVNTIVSESGPAEQATLTLTSGAAGAGAFDIAVGAVTAVNVTELLTTITNPAQFDSTVTINGDLTVDGTLTTINTTEIVIDDVNIVLASGATTSATLDGAGITLGDGTIATFNYVDALGTWDLSTGLGVAEDSSITIPQGEVSGTTETVLNADLTMRTDAPYIYFGANREWRLGISNDGNDHFEIAHDDAGGDSGTYVVKLDVQE